MYRLKVHRSFEQFSDLLYRAGLWHRSDKETVGERRLKIFYSIYFSLFPISIAAGAIESNDNDEKVFCGYSVLMTIVFQTKLLYLIWKKKEILDLFNLVCDYCVKDCETYNLVNDKSKIFMKFSVSTLNAIYVGVAFAALVEPFVGAERKLLFRFGLIFDWRRNEFAFWAAFIFTVIIAAIATVLMTFTLFLWYLLASCSWSYEALGCKMKKMGETGSDQLVGKRRSIERDNLYNRDLVGAITSYNSLKEYKRQRQKISSRIIHFSFTFDHQNDQSTVFILKQLICSSNNYWCIMYWFIDLHPHFC